MTVNVFPVFVLLAATGVLAQPRTFPPLDTCFGTVCQNGGTCIQPRNVAICQCPGGFGGDRCENVVREKIGTCVIPPYTGPLNCTRGCDKDYDCPGSQKCCNTRCERQCTNNFVIDPCSRYCLNGGTCVAPADAPECRCPSGFSGKRCQIADTNPSTCPKPTSYKACGAGSTCLTDRQCNRDEKCCLNGCGRKTCTAVGNIRDPCNGFCLHGGICLATGYIPSCKCPKEYSGKRCEINVHSGKCPKPVGSSVCGGVECKTDGDCKLDKKCCRLACGGTWCTQPV